MYPERNEALINAGTIALSKETSAFPGFGLVIDPRSKDLRSNWSIVRTSQEHGILGIPGLDGGTRSTARVEQSFRLGQKVSC